MEKAPKPLTRNLHIDTTSVLYQAHHEHAGLDEMPATDKIRFEKSSNEPVALAPNETVGIPKVIVPET